MRHTFKIINGKSALKADGARKTEEELIKLAVAGDKDAFKELFEPYFSQLFVFINNSVRNAQDAEDILQETMVKAFLNLKNFRQDSSIKTWAYRIASNLCIDFQRKKRIKTYSLNEISGEHVEVVDKSDNPEEAFSQNQERTTISKAIGDLSPEHREVVILREIDGQSYEEISDSLGVTIGTVMSRLHYARKSLQKSLSKFLKT